MIHFTSLFGIDFDFDLLVPWITHYLSYRFDRYEIYLHSRRNDTARLGLAANILDSLDVKNCVVCADEYDRHRIGIDPSSTLRQLVIDAHVKKLASRASATGTSSDYLVVADSDEFQQMPDNYRELIPQYDYIFGALIDRYDTTLHEIVPGVPLHEQYPQEGDVHDLIVKSAGPVGQHWFYLYKTKILASRVDIPVNHVGSHGLMGKRICTGASRASATEEGYRVLDEINGVKPIPVHHYTWRPSILPRMCDRPYYTAQRIWLTARFFGIDNYDSEEFRKKIAQEDALQKEKGWEPCRSQM